ncbi:hypothetical protein BJ875DRAFT_514196 [Amylocarpus encephaloides]|uniref:Uncharacterized protein n=1 Tax=Amylocarpus encephaloides TaxID=45428 RepID=A0A9P7YF44_9HELO|nr:hypothetical protein BJ875DRAFT_514196 [Amylocarpus encephaloides]
MLLVGSRVTHEEEQEARRRARPWMSESKSNTAPLLDPPPSQASQRLQSGHLTRRHASEPLSTHPASIHPSIHPCIRRRRPPAPLSPSIAFDEADETFTGRRSLAPARDSRLDRGGGFGGPTASARHESEGASRRQETSRGKVAGCAVAPGEGGLGHGGVELVREGRRGGCGMKRRAEWRGEWNGEESGTGRRESWTKPRSPLTIKVGSHVIHLLVSPRGAHVPERSMRHLGHPVNPRVLLVREKGVIKVAGWTG